MQNILETPDSYSYDNIYHCSAIPEQCKTWYLGKKESLAPKQQDVLPCFRWKWSGSFFLIRKGKKYVSGLQTVLLGDCVLDTVITTRANRQSRSTTVLASLPVVESAGYILFNDNILIPLNSIIAGSKWPSTAKVGARDLKALCMLYVEQCFCQPLLSVAWGQYANVDIRSTLHMSGDIGSLSCLSLYF